MSSSRGGWGPATFAVCAGAAVGGLLYLQALSIERAADKVEAAAKERQEQAPKALAARAGAGGVGAGPSDRAASPPDAAPRAASSSDEAPAERARGGASSSGGSAPREHALRKQQAAAAGSGQEAPPRGGAARGDDAPKHSELLAAISGLVQRQADAHGGGLAGGLQSAVAQFVQGEFRPAAAALAEVAARARAEQRPELAAEALRWLGHAHSRLGAPARAAAAFAEGAEVATAVGFKRLQVECLCGLGTLHDSQGQSEVAVAYLRQALAVAESMDGGGGPSRADVLVHLARSLMPTDAAEATAMLEDAVRLREAKIVELHEAGERNGMASAIMEHASALATLAGARYGCQRYHEARDAYAQVLEVFGAVGDADRVAQTLVSLANLHELQLEEPGALEAAAGYRRELFRIAKKYLRRDPPEACAICLEAIDPRKPCAADAPAPAKAAAAAAKAALAAGATTPAPAQPRRDTPAEPAAEGPEAEAPAPSEAEAAGAPEPQPGCDDDNAAAAAAPLAGAPEPACRADDEAPRDQQAAADDDGSARKAGRLITLPCLHVHHNGCFKKWMLRNDSTSCPSCKQPVPLD